MVMGVSCSIGHGRSIVVCLWAACGGQERRGKAGVREKVEFYTSSTGGNGRSASNHSLEPPPTSSRVRDDDRQSKLTRMKFESFMQHCTEAECRRRGAISRGTCYDWVYQALETSMLDLLHHTSPESIRELCQETHGWLLDLSRVIDKHSYVCL